MSDYMFMLDSHLSPEQAQVLTEVQTAAGEANVNLFLAGGAMRDMLGGCPIRDLDFTIEGDALRLTKKLVQRTKATILSSDEHRKSVELLFPGGVTGEISMARQERYPKPGGRPQVQPSTIHEDLRGRDFTVNAIALSLNRASRGLLIDPNNGLADLERKELRAVGNYSLYDDPVRLLRLVRLRVRLGFTVELRTEQQYRNARESAMETHVSPQTLGRELRHIANEANAADVVHALDQEGLLQVFSPALKGPKLNLSGLIKLQRAKQLIPFAADIHLNNLGLFLNLLTEKLTPKEKAALIKNAALTRKDTELWRSLESRAKKVERDLRSPKLHKPSEVYKRLLKVPGDEVLFLQIRSPQRLVHDRIRNYLQKYLPVVQEITDRDVEAGGAAPGTPKFEKAKQALIVARLEGRHRKSGTETENPAALSAH